MILSVIIPTLNEEKALPSAVRSLLEEAPLFEVIVSDGGSRDQTQAWVRKAANSKIKLVVTERGRGRQMNAGARASGGDILFFLHADCSIQAGTLSEVVRVIQGGAVGGCLTQVISHPSIVFRWIEKSGVWRSKRKHIFYADQGIFVKREIFERMDGFKEWDLFEDVDFSRRLAREGKTVILDKKIFTSSRRWAAQGVILTTLINRVLLIMYWLKIPPHYLARFYRPVR